MRRAWAVWAGVWLGLGCSAVVEPPEPDEPPGVQARAMQETRGITRHVRPVEGSVLGRTVAVDRRGNAFISLTYERSGVDLGGGALPGTNGLALAKYAPDGTHLWSRAFPTYIDSQPTVSAMAVDEAGNLYVSGAHREPTLSLGGEPVPAGLFLAKYAPDGTHLWSHGTSLAGVELLPPSALAVDEKRGQLVAAVNFLDPGRPIGAALLGRVRVEDGRVLALKPVVRWGSLSVTSLAVDSSSCIAVAGFFEGEVDLGGGPFTTTRPRSPFVARFSPEMNHQWSRGLVGAEGSATGVALEPGRLIVVGEYSGDFTFRGHSRPAEGRDAFVAAYNGDGQEVWARHFAEGATAVAIDAENRVVVTGQYRPGDSVGGSRLPSRPGGSPDNHLFVVKLYRGSGGLEWSRGLFSDEVLRGGRLAVTRSGEVLLLSSAAGSAEVGTGPVRVPSESAVLLRFGR